jgi:hypothetical protein
MARLLFSENSLNSSHLHWTGERYKTMNFARVIQISPSRLIRFFVLLLFSGSCAFSQPGTASEKSEQPSSDSAIISIHGFCPDSARERSNCVTVVTRKQFEQMLSAMNVNPRLANNPVAIRNFAENYVEILALSSAAEKSGVEKDPEVQELLRLVRMRALADAFRQRLQQNANPSEQEIEQYYHQNQSRFEQVELDRIAIPRTNPALKKEAQADFEHKAEQLAQDIRVRVLKGEEPSKLQAEAYKSLGLTPPLTTDLRMKRRGSLPTALEQEIFSLKAGEVSGVRSDAVNYTIFKVRSHSISPLEKVKAEISGALRQKKFDEGVKQATGQFHAEFDPQYFGSNAGSPRTQIPPSAAGR